MSDKSSELPEDIPSLDDIDDLAFPVRFVSGQPPTVTSLGLTKREWFAGMALQGVLATCDPGVSMKDVALDAVEVADALIEALNNGR